MNKSNLIKETVILSVLLIPLIIMLVIWNRLPEKLPLHWNINGEIDRDGPKYVFLLLNIGLYLLFLVIPKIDPRKKNYTIFTVSYYKLRLIFTTYFSLFSLVVFYNALYSNVNFEKLFPVTILFLFALLGNYFGTIRSNYFVGIRTPWTLNNDEVWKKTHLLAGRLWVACGIVGGFISWSLNMPFASYFAIGIMVVMVILPVVYSYVYYQRIINVEE